MITVVQLIILVAVLILGAALMRVYENGRIRSASREAKQAERWRSEAEELRVKLAVQIEANRHLTGKAYSVQVYQGNTNSVDCEGLIFGDREERELRENGGFVRTIRKEGC